MAETSRTNRSATPTRSAPPRRIELLAVDLDGTLLSSRGELSDRNRAALHRAHEAGVRVVLTTGRAFPETKPVLDKLGLDLDAAITAGGAIITEVASGRTLERAGINPEVAVAAARWFREREYAVIWLCDGHGCEFDAYVIDGPRRPAAFDRWVQSTPCRLIEVPTLPDAPTPAVRLTIVDERERLDLVARDLQTTFNGQLCHNILTINTTGLTLIESFAASVNKWFAIERLCRRWGIGPHRTAAIGDDVNDLQMVQKAGLGVAVANAQLPILQAARRVVASNDAGGVAEFVDQILAMNALADGAAGKQP